MPDKLRPPLGRIAVAQRDVGGKYDKDDLLTFYNEHGGDLQNGPFFYCVNLPAAAGARVACGVARGAVAVRWRASAGRVAYIFHFSHIDSHTAPYSSSRLL